MKLTLALLAAVTLAGIGSTRALAGRDPQNTPALPKTPATEKSCCAMDDQDHHAHAPAAPKDAAGMCCQTDGHGSHAAAKSKPVEHKSCCG